MLSCIILKIHPVFKHHTTNTSPNPNIEQGKLNQQVQQWLESGNSLTSFGEPSFKILLPEIVAAVTALLSSVVIGISFGYSAILIPQLIDAQNTTSNITSDGVVIKTTETGISWIAGVLPTIVVPSSIFSGIMVDNLGRLNTLKLSAIPNAIGWLIIAVATNVPMLIIGRILTGMTIVFGISPAIVYVTEISSPKIRGALTCISPCGISLGMMLVYMEGWFLHWRTVAWISLGYIIIPLMLIILYLPESPTWLVSKNRIPEAARSLEWFNRYRKHNSSDTPTYSDVQLYLLQKNHMQKHGVVTETNKCKALKNLKMLSDATVYKPLLLLTVLYIFQQFSGLYITLFYTVTFFRAVGTEMSSYLATVLVGAIRFILSVFVIFLMAKFKRRPLIILSGLGMCISIGVSGLFTDLIKYGDTSLTWLPVLMIILYVSSSMVGFLGIPWTITGELFPTEVRGMGNSICLGIAHLFMFLTVQNYFSLVRFFGGMAGLQYFFAVVSFAGAIYCYIFLPETHNRQLGDIQDYFRERWIYISLYRVKSKKIKISSTSK